MVSVTTLLLLIGCVTTKFTGVLDCDPFHIDYEFKGRKMDNETIKHIVEEAGRSFLQGTGSPAIGLQGSAPPQSAENAMAKRELRLKECQKEWYKVLSQKITQ